MMFTFEIKETSVFMSLELLSTIVSFLDLNDFQDCNGTVTLCDLLDLSIPERQQVLTFWLKNSVFEFHQNYNKTWFSRNGKIHKTNGPAVLWNCGTKEWFFTGKPHRGGDEPAVQSTWVDSWHIFKGQKNEWIVNGERHRENDMPAVVDQGRREWFVNGRLHRTLGPAIESESGAKEWYVNGIEQVWFENERNFG